jgi:hypothetical protein
MYAPTRIVNGQLERESDNKTAFASLEFFEFRQEGLAFETRANQA